MKHKSIVVDANIVIRAVLGKKVFELIKKHAHHVKFYTPDVCFQDAQIYLPGLFEKRGRSPEIALQMLSTLIPLLQVIDESVYQSLEVSAKMRIGSRDIDDWPIVAGALVLNCPVWTHDMDFFGAGVATWTTDTVSIYFSED